MFFIIFSNGFVYSNSSLISVFHFGIKGETAGPFYGGFVQGALVRPVSDLTLSPASKKGWKAGIDKRTERQDYPMMPLWQGGDGYYSKSPKGIVEVEFALLTVSIDSCFYVGGRKMEKECAVADHRGNWNIPIEDIKILGNNLLLKPIFLEESSLIITNRETLYAEVVSVGTGRLDDRTGKRHPIEGFKDGDIVIMDHIAVENSRDYHIFLQINEELLILKGVNLIEAVVEGELNKDIQRHKIIKGRRMGK